MIEKIEIRYSKVGNLAFIFKEERGWYQVGNVDIIPQNSALCETPVNMGQYSTYPMSTATTVKLRMAMRRSR